MRYQSALVLSTLVVSQAAAGSVRHASFHARRQAEAKRDMADVDWSKVSYDLSGVNWASVFASQTPTPAPSQAQEQPKPSVAEAAPSTESTPEVTSEEPAATSAAAPAQTGSAGDAVEGFFEDVSTFISSLGISKGVNSKTSNGGVWQGDDGKYKATFINDASDDIAIVCWTEAGKFVNTMAPQIFLGVKGGGKLTLSFADGLSGGCAPVVSGTDLLYGLVNQSWLEFTWGSGVSGAFDISREVNMKGNVMTAKGSQCTSGVKDGALSCTFQCKDSSLSTCGVAGSYDLFGCGAGSGGGGGYDAAMGGTGGGCTMGNDGESLEVTVFGNSNWPSA